MATMMTDDEKRRQAGAALAKKKEQAFRAPVSPGVVRTQQPAQQQTLIRPDYSRNEPTGNAALQQNLLAAINEKSSAPKIAGLSKAQQGSFDYSRAVRDERQRKGLMGAALSAAIGAGGRENVAHIRNQGEWNRTRMLERVRNAEIASREGIAGMREAGLDRRLGMQNEQQAALQGNRIQSAEKIAGDRIAADREMSSNRIDAMDRQARERLKFKVYDRTGSPLAANQVGSNFGDTDYSDMPTMPSDDDSYVYDTIGYDGDGRPVRARRSMRGAIHPDDQELADYVRKRYGKDAI